MGLPKRAQPISLYIQQRLETYESVAAALGFELNRFSNIVKGLTRPSPNELDLLEKHFSLPAQILFEPCVVVFRDKGWPLPRGTAFIEMLERARAQGLPVDPEPTSEERIAAWRRAHEEYIASQQGRGE